MDSTNQYSLSSVSGTTDLYGVIGSPITHSLSPKIYNFCFSKLGIDAVYLAFECEKDAMPSMISSIRTLNIKGVNCTMPCKQPAAEMVDSLVGAAKYAKAVNTITNNNGVLTGYITDGKGVVLDMQNHGIDVLGKKIVQVGMGGAGSAIAIQCALDGAESVHIFNRGTDKLNHAKDIAIKMKDDGVNCHFLFNLLSEEDALRDALSKADILINATSMGMAPNNIHTSFIGDTNWLHKDLSVYDVVYNPAETKLIKQAKSVGCKNVIGGKGMLMWQAVEALRIYTGLAAPVDELKELLNL